MFWIGLQREGTKLVWAKLHKKGKKVTFLELQEQELHSLVSPLVLPYQEQETYLIAGLSAQDVLLKELDLPLQKRKTLRKILPFQIEPLLPYPPEDAVVTLQTSTPMRCFAAKYTTLQEHASSWKVFSLEPDAISCVPTALHKFAKYFFPQEKHALLLHMDLHTSTLVYQDHAGIKFFCTIPLGFLSLQEEQARYARELHRALACLAQKFPSFSKVLLLTGHFSSLSQDILKNIFDFLAGSAWSILPIPKNFAPYAIPIGLALEGIFLDKNSSFFSSQIVLSKTLVKKRKKALTFFAASMTALTALTLILGTFTLRKQEQSLLQGFASVMKEAKVTPTSWQDLQELLPKAWEQLQQTKTPYPLHSPVPCVTKVLAWLSTYPSSINVRTMDYTLTSYPQATTPKAPYIGKLSMTIQIQDPLEAENFRESLGQVSSLAYQDRNLSWLKQGDTYLVSFLLQPHKETR